MAMPEWWVCHGFLENGFNIGQHICSHPIYAPGDIWKNRPERQKAVKEIFGDNEVTKIEVITIESLDDAPVPLRYQPEDKFKDEYARYESILKGKQVAQVLIEYSE
jgi:hypothetical protein